MAFETRPTGLLENPTAAPIAAPTATRCGILVAALVLLFPLSVAVADSAPSTSRSTAHSPDSHSLGSPSAGFPSAGGSPWRQMHAPADISPPGWRKEDGVWKRLDGTPLPDPDPGRTINDLIRRQRALETGDGTTRFLATLMMYLRALDPISLASAQVSAFCLLAYRVLRRG